MNSNICPKYVQDYLLQYHLYWGLINNSLWVRSGLLPGFVNSFIGTSQTLLYRSLEAAFELGGQS